MRSAALALLNVVDPNLALTTQIWNISGITHEAGGLKSGGAGTHKTTVKALCYSAS